MLAWMLIPWVIHAIEPLITVQNIEDTCLTCTSPLPSPPHCRALPSPESRSKEVLVELPAPLAAGFRVQTTMRHGSVVIAAITNEDPPTCTNTSDPSGMLAAGLLAKKAADRGLKVVPPTMKLLRDCNDT